MEIHGGKSEIIFVSTPAIISGKIPAWIAENNNDKNSEGNPPESRFSYEKKSLDTSLGDFSLKAIEQLLNKFLADSNDFL